MTSEVLYAPIHPELKELAFEAADNEGMALNEWVARLIAERLSRPDLSRIPRRRRGPKKTSANHE